jgi:GntR family transcriptional regulator
MARHPDGRPPYQQIAAELRARILSGDLAPGAQLPPTPRLVTSYQAANTTIQKALGMLKAEGYLNSRMGKGVYVRDRNPLVVEAVSYLQPSLDEYSYQLLEVAEVPLPADVASALGARTAVLRNRLMRHHDDAVEL